MQASPEIQRRAAYLPSVYRQFLDLRPILALWHKRLRRVNPAVLYSTKNLMLFSGKTMALPQQSASCQVFVKKTVSVCCFIFVSSAFSSFYAKGIFKRLSRHRG